MISAVRQTVYQAFGLRISSEIPLPELPLSAGGEDRAGADVVIATRVTDRLGDELEAVGSNFARIGNRFLFLIPETAFYCIEDGQRITVSPLAGADPEKVRVYLLGTCMGALLMLRGVLPLHGSAVEIDGKAYAFVGDSGAGKSTLAAAFVGEGYRLVSDDVIAASWADGGGLPIVSPAYPQQKLWRESIEQLGLSKENGSYRTIYRETAKFAVPATEGFCDGPVPLAGVFELARPQGEATIVRPLPNLERLRVMLLHTYRNRLIHRLGLEKWHFKAAAGIAEQAKIYQLSRPQAGFTAHRLVSEIIQTIREGEKDR
ncbi:aldolase [Paenibacillus sp. R14(2021)]|uniref:aldolase n=1 Tax=Paenibacillus sp. R14(2021) TaxID=2859228 RepID=UPI001C611E5C|nr:aldolase [Paenibacillus sp. R14(2021)]